MIDTFFELQIKGGALIAISVLIYFLLLSRDRSFHRNRVWLLSSLFIPWMVPLMAMPVWVKERLWGQVAEVNNAGLPLTELVTQNNVITMHPESGISWEMIVVTLYFIVSLVFLLRLFWGYGFLFRLMRQGDKLTYKGLRVIKVSKQEVSPFSFFRTIFIPEHLEEKSDKHLVLEHEKTHCDQWHSVDRSLVEWVLILHWWNPFAWWLRKLIAQNHEYCVDNAMIRQTVQAKTYQYSLIHLMPGKQSLRLVNNFNRNLTKKRIVMMNKENTNRFIGVLKTFLIVPLLGMMILAFTDPDKTVDNEIKKDTSAAINDIEQLRNYLARNVKYPLEAQKAGQQGEVIAHINVDKKGRPGKPVIGKARGNNVMKLDEVVIVSYNTVKDGQSYSESEKKVSQKALDREMERVLRTLPTLTNVNWRGKTLELKFVFVLQDNIKKDKALYFVDDEEVSEKVVELLDIDRIQSMNVIKGKDAIEKYGERAKDGAIEVTSKGSDVSIIKVKGESSMQQPLIILDGEKAENGVVVIASKVENDAVETDAGVISLKCLDTSVKESIINIKGKGGKGQPLYVVDGVELSDSDFKKVRKNDIEAITVLKDKYAIEKYGEKAKNGVVVIDLKETIEQ
ncbi:MAG: hypothetical protein JEZ14_05975 [Marinilabiliaceae bacterium]|nr:hypothetical protein [Marinilabiliaceae bacterium]